MPQIYISKYNRFVDAVLTRINRMLGKQYDPVRVKLLTASQRNNMKNKTKNTKNKKRTAGKDAPNLMTEKTNKMGELEIARQNNKRKPATSNVPKKTTTNKKKATITKTGNKVKQTSAKNKQKAKATLFGLSTLKRDGDVTVNMTPKFTTVKSNFVMGPLTLRVEREVGRSGKRELRSATATTADMFGRLNLKLVHGGAASLQSIRVLQPKQVRIDTPDNHDKSTEFMWKRSPQIASIVTQKLGAVTRSMLKPPPQSRP
ncbi:hypothetical protein YQE_06880, partial [Dendroctonus ponderosae]